MKTANFNSIDTYISLQNGDVKVKLEKIRNIIHKAAPNAIEVISYQMPAFKQNRVLVYFAAFKNHIGFYPTASGIENFKNEFSGLTYSKGAVQFPLDKPIPFALITKIVKFRVKEDEVKSR
jgi:uncharacterized protein YdhG (YjbR/CyaY superfamily)